MGKPVTQGVDVRQLVADLDRIMLEANEAGRPFREEVSAYLGANPVDLDSVAPYAHFLENGYTRNLVEKTPRFEALLLCWQPGHVSSVHNHRDQQCWMAMVLGQLENQNFRVWNKNPATRTCEIEATERFLITRDTPAAVDMEEPVHQISNLKEWQQPAISLHVYAAPFNSCEVYCPEKKVYCDIPLTYWSEAGEVTRAQAPDPCDEA